MGGVISGILQKDLDDLFSYNTPKIVRVRDRRLGIPYYSFMIAIFVYICYTVIANQRYLNTEEPGGGSIRTTLQLPSDVDSRPDNEPLPFVNKNNETEQISWVYWSPSQIVYPAGQDGCLFITTRVTEKSLIYYKTEANSDPNCNPFLPESRKCRTVTNNNKELTKTYYVADIEDMTIMVEHTIRGNLLPITEVNRKLYGQLLDKDDNVVWKYYPRDYKEEKIDDKKCNESKNCTIRSSSIPGDVFPVKRLLNAAGLDLDHINNGNEPYRYSGCVIVVIIEYNNKHNSIGYKYKPSLIENAEMKILELVNDINYVNENTFRINGQTPNNTINQSVGWLEYNRHGIEIKFVQLGDIGKFDFMALCMNLVASIAMLSVASTVVESLMLYVLPEKGIYRKFKYELTEDFSDIRDNNKLAKKELNEMREKQASNENFV